MSTNCKQYDTKIKGIEVHPAAGAFPLMDAEAFAELVADIKEHGQRESCTTWKGQLIDGRNRWLACQELGIEPDIGDIEDDDFDVVSYVVSANIYRRHLTPSDRAIIGAKLKPEFAAAAKERQKRKPKSVPIPVSEQKGDAREQVAKLVGVSPAMIDRAAKVKEKGSPELYQAVRDGEVTVSAAAKVVDLPPGEQVAAAKAKPGKGETSTVRPEATTDAKGAKLPAKMVAAFELRAEFDRIKKVMIDLSVDIADLAAGPAGVFLHSQSLLADLATVRNAIKFGRPYAICKQCKGKGCTGCKDSGWLNKERHERGPG